MVVADDAPHDMGANDADEADHPQIGNDDRGDKRSKKQTHEAKERNPHADGRGEILAGR